MSEIYDRLPTDFVEQCCDMAHGCHDYDPLEDPDRRKRVIDPRSCRTEYQIETAAIRNSIKDL